MTTTPTVWLSTFMANLATTGSQTDPVITGLSNGNILVVWTDSNDTAGPDAGTDIVGVIFDATGNVVVGPQQINTFGTALAERNPTVAATSDGGFVMVYQRLSGAGNDLFFERYTATAVFTQRDFLESGSASGPVFSNASVAVRPDGSFLVSYESDNGTDEDVVGRIVTAGGTVGARFDIRSDDDPSGGTSNPRSPSSAALTNGVVVTVYIEDDIGEPDVEIRAVNADGSLGFNVNVTNDSISDRDPDIAALAGGGFVVVWEANDDIRAQVYAADGTTVGVQFPVASGAADQNEPVVIGLEDGGFFVVWDNDTGSQLEGQRFSATGAPVGVRTIITTDASAPANTVTTPELGLTSDGRILVTWGNGEVFVAILDPREPQITVQAGDGVTTGRQDGSTITGTSGADVIIGGAGDDIINGGSGTDSIVGGAGDDSISGGSTFDDTLRGGAGNDTLQAVGGGLIEGNAGNDTFTVLNGNVIGDTDVSDSDLFDGGDGIDTFDASAELSAGYSIDLNAQTVDRGTIGNRTVTLTNFENAVGSQTDDDVRGNGIGNLLRGEAGNDTLFGFGGDDTMSGDDGNDEVRGNAGNDVVGGEAGNDSLFGGEGNDSLFGGGGNDMLNGGSGNDVFNGGAGFDMADYSAASENLVVNINFAGTQRVSGLQGRDQFVSIEGINGGSGNDLLVGSSAGNVIDGGDGNDEIYGIGGGDVLRGGAGNDLIEGSGGNDTMDGGVGAHDILSYFNSAGGVTVDLRAQGTVQAVGGTSGNDVFTGFEDLYGSNAGDDRLTGSNDANTILGYAGNDVISGAGGNDFLLGMGGDDTLVGGAGSDTLRGGGGADVFDFNSVSHSIGASRDTIEDFGTGADLIDLSNIDANLLAGGNQAFSFIGSAGFSAAGQLRFATNGTDGFLQGDIDGDGTVDLNIQFQGVTSISAADILL